MNKREQMIGLLVAGFKGACMSVEQDQAVRKWIKEEYENEEIDPKKAPGPGGAQFDYSMRPTWDLREWQQACKGFQKDEDLTAYVQNVLNQLPPIHRVLIQQHYRQQYETAPRPAVEQKDLVMDYLESTGEKYYNHSEGPKRKSALEMVEEFHQAFNCPVLKTPIMPDVPFGYALSMDNIERIKQDFSTCKDRSRSFLRIKLMFEEFTEVCEAISTHDMVKILDGLCDLLYVVYGTAHEFGLGPILKEAFREVHRSNMSKLNGDGTPIIRNDGKVLKGPNFTPPDLARIINKAMLLPPPPVEMINATIEFRKDPPFKSIEELKEKMPDDLIFNEPTLDEWAGKDDPNSFMVQPDNYERQVTDEQPPVDGDY